jgi:hypothetical protein
MKTVLVYTAYIWIGLLHAFFVGTCLYAWAGNWLKTRSPIVAWVIIFAILAFFETYWILVFDYFGLQVYTIDADILAAFGISETDNLVHKLSPRAANIVFWVFSTFVADAFGKKLNSKMARPS